MEPGGEHETHSQSLANACSALPIMPSSGRKRRRRETRPASGLRSKCPDLVMLVLAVATFNLLTLAGAQQETTTPSPEPDVITQKYENETGSYLIHIFKNKTKIVESCSPSLFGRKFSPVFGFSGTVLCTTKLIVPPSPSVILKNDTPSEVELFINQTQSNRTIFPGIAPIDPVNGIELNPLTMNQEPEPEMANNRTCQRRDYDRIIRQKMARNSLSRAIILPDGHFENPFSTWRRTSAIDLFKFMIMESDESAVPSDRSLILKELPMINPDFTIDPTNEQDFRLTWIGHSTTLIQVDGYNILTDPIFSDRASIVQFFGPKRIREPACEVADLPQIHAVIISHNHYDHLDVSSVKDINERFGTSTRWMVPKGLGDFMRSLNVKNFVELDWWQKDCLLGKAPEPSISNVSEAMLMEEESYGKNTTLDIYFTPTQHWSRRGISDINKSLWGSYVIVNKKGASFFFAGDTGYCSAFEEIGSIFGPFAGAAIPIGAYKPRWFLQPSHVDPVEAVQIHRDLRSLKSVAIHHSTFILSYEPYKEPIKWLNNTMSELLANNTVRQPFIGMKHGESVSFYSNPSRHG